MTRDRSSTIVKIEIGRIRENLDNPRVRVTGIERLARSIAQVGIQVPVLVHQKYERAAGGQDLELIFGHRRLRAAHRVELATVPGQILPFQTPEQILLRMLTEREREPHEPEAITTAVRKLRQRHGMSVLDIATKLGTSQGQVTAWLNGEGDLPEVPLIAPNTPSPARPQMTNQGAVVGMTPKRVGSKANPNPAPHIPARRLYDVVAQVDGGSMDAVTAVARMRALLKGWAPS